MSMDIHEIIAAAFESKETEKALRYIADLMRDPDPPGLDAVGMIAGQLAAREIQIRVLFEARRRERLERELDDVAGWEQWLAALTNHRWRPQSANALASKRPSCVRTTNLIRSIRTSS